MDDDAENRDILRRRLEREGFYAADEGSGAAAIARARREKFDLVLLDLFMPVMDGFEVLAAMKADAELRTLPVVVLSALDDQETAVRSIEAGAEDFLSKPADPVILRARLGAILRRTRAEAERAELEEQLMQGAKLESLGVLAGGLAHDFNNILTGIMGNASLVMELFPPGDPNRALLDEVVNASERAADLTRQMLAFAGKGQFVIEPVDLSKTVEGIEDLIQSSLPKQATLSMQLARDLPPVDADPGQIQQLLLNLVINAGEAIGEESGMVIVETARSIYRRGCRQSRRSMPRRRAGTRPWRCGTREPGWIRRCGRGFSIRSSPPSSPDGDWGSRRRWESCELTRV